MEPLTAAPGRGRSIGAELEQQRLLDRERRIRRALRSLHAIADSHEETPPRPLLATIADLQRQLDDVDRRVAEL